MARSIKLTPAEVAELSHKRVLDGEIKLRKDERRATVAFTPVAWVKMYALIDSFNKEVQWHGLVTRLDESTFLIEDILVFPHVASATTVVSDQEEYEEWMNNLSDEQFNACRFHGHSHVHMQVIPSVTDLTYRKNIFENFSTNPMPDEDQFYIFLIFNKRREFSGQVYDITQNALYDTSEIDLEILIENDWISNFTLGAKEIVKDPVVAQPTINKQNDTKKEKGSINSPSGTTVGATQTSLYPYQTETDEEWRTRVYGGGKTDSADKEYLYSPSGFKGGTYGK